MLEIARALGIPQSSAAGILRTLLRLGYLVQDAHRRYRPTPRVTLLGSWVDPILARDGPLMSLMNHLSSLTGETIILAVPTDSTVRYIHVIPSTKRVRLHVNVGDERPMVISGIGRLFLSTMDIDQARRAVFRYNAMRGSKEAEINLATVRRDALQIRKIGYCVSLDRVVRGVGLVCALIPHRAHSDLMAVAIGGPSSTIRAQSEEFARMMQDGLREYLGDD